MKLQYVLADVMGTCVAIFDGLLFLRALSVGMPDFERRRMRNFYLLVRVLPWGIKQLPYVRALYSLCYIHYSAHTPYLANAAQEEAGCATLAGFPVPV
jgi:hypothetical protein